MDWPVEIWGLCLWRLSATARKRSRMIRTMLRFLRGERFNGTLHVVRSVLGSQSYTHSYQACATPVPQSQHTIIHTSGFLHRIGSDPCGTSSSHPFNGKPWARLNSWSHCPADFASSSCLASIARYMKSCFLQSTLN